MGDPNLLGPALAVAAVVALLIAVALVWNTRRPEGLAPALAPGTYVGVDDWIKYRTQLDTIYKELLLLRVETTQQAQTILQLTAAVEHAAREAWARDRYLQELESGLTRLAPVDQATVLGALLTARPPVLLHPPTPLPPVPRVRERVTNAAAADLVSILAAADWIATTQESRSTYLLAGLPATFTQRIARSGAAEADLVAIVMTALNFSDGAMSGLLDNATHALTGTSHGAYLMTWIARWGEQAIEGPGPTAPPDQP